MTEKKIAVTPIITGVTAILFFTNCQRRDYDEETIIVSITGNSNYIGNSFKISKKYTLSDIVYDEHEPKITKIKKNIFTGKELRNPLNGKIIKKIDWDELSKIVEVDEIGRRKSVKEIRYIIKNMKKNRR